MSQIPAGWVVKPVAGAAAVKDYTCPRCNQLVRPGTPHVVAWQETWSGGVEDRRHWHTACWRRFAERAEPGSRGQKGKR